MMSEMGKERKELLQAMSIVDREEAHKHLSEAGSDVLEMMEYASGNLWTSMRGRGVLRSSSRVGVRFVYLTRRRA